MENILLTRGHQSLRSVCSLSGLFKMHIISPERLQKTIRYTGLDGAVMFVCLQGVNIKLWSLILQFVLILNPDGAQNEDAYKMASKHHHVVCKASANMSPQSVLSSPGVSSSHHSLSAPREQHFIITSTPTPPSPTSIRQSSVSCLMVMTHLSA